MNDSTKSILLALSAFATYSIGDIIRKVLMLEYEPIAVQAYVTTCSVITIFLFAIFSGRIQKLFPFSKPYLVGFRCILMTIAVMGSYMGIQYLDLPTFYALIFVAPLITAVLARIYFQELLRPHHILTLLIGFIGVLIVLRPGLNVINIGAIATLMGATSFSITAVTNKLFPKDYSYIVLTFYPFVAACMVFWVLAYPAHISPDIFDIILMLCAGICAPMGLILLIKAFQISPANVPSPFHYTQIIWGIAFGYILFNTLPDIWTWIGGTLIIGAGLYLYLVEKQRAKTI